MNYFWNESSVWRNRNTPSSSLKRSFRCNFRSRMFCMMLLSVLNSFVEFPTNQINTNHKNCLYLSEPSSKSNASFNFSELLLESFCSSNSIFCFNKKFSVFNSRSLDLNPSFLSLSVMNIRYHWQSLTYSCVVHFHIDSRFDSRVESVAVTRIFSVDKFWSLLLTVVLSSCTQISDKECVGH